MSDEMFDEHTANNAKTGITSGQASAITANTAKTGITSGQASAITANTAKTGITSGQASAITANTAKTGITSGQASAITANTAKATNATHTGEVTGDAALTIAADVVDEANLKVGGTLTDDYVLTADTGATGGMKWAATAGTSTFYVQRFNGDTSTVAFTLSQTPVSENNTQVYISGVYQQKDTYAVSGTTLTFSSAPSTGTGNIEVVTQSTAAIGTTTSDLVTFSPTGTGATNRTTQAKLRDRVSVKDFGATGDGTTDDTAAIALGITAAGTSAILHFPAGTYLISSTLTFKSYYRWQGDGAANTKINYSGSGTAISNDSILTDHATLSEFHLSDTGTGTVGMALGHSRNLYAAHITVTGFTTNWAVNKSTVGISNYRNTFFKCTSSTSATTGWLIGDSTSGEGANENRFYSCQSILDPLGVHIVRASGCEFYGFEWVESTTVLTLAAGSKNNIQGYAEATVTDLGTAASGTVQNLIDLTIDGSPIAFVDSGANSVEYTNEVGGPIRRANVEIIDNFNMTFTAVTDTAFSLDMPYNSSFTVTLSAAGLITGVANYTEEKTWFFRRVGDGTATVSLIAGFGDDKFVPYISTGLVSIVALGHVSLSSRYRVAVKIVGSGSTSTGANSNPTYTRDDATSPGTIANVVDHQSTHTATVELSSANLLALTTPITLVAAQGADTVIEFVSALLIHDAGTAYVEPSAPDDMVIQYDTGTDASASIDATGFLTVTSDEIRLVPSTLALSVDLVPEKNKAIEIINTGSDYTTGTGTMTVKVTYRVHTLGL
jgi:hypothetical protein